MVYIVESLLGELWPPLDLQRMAFQDEEGAMNYLRGLGALLDSGGQNIWMREEIGFRLIQPDRNIVEFTVISVWFLYISSRTALDEDVKPDSPYG
ncbi:hypothetical protein [Labrys sp. 22185]|uniref:hypothetical protein n=1 Tax=Labrys sp. 22185 TaxID=3453888 RepID=UPI003F86F524